MTKLYVRILYFQATLCCFFMKYIVLTFDNKQKSWLTSATRWYHYCSKLSLSDSSYNLLINFIFNRRSLYEFKNYITVQPRKIDQYNANSPSFCQMKKSGSKHYWKFYYFKKMRSTLHQWTKLNEYVAISQPSKNDITIPKQTLIVQSLNRQL